MLVTATDPAPPHDILEEALRLAGLGWRVLPIKPGEKYPPMASWQHAASADEATIRNWFGGLYRGHGLGVATGPLSDGTWLFVLDVDEKPGISGAETLADLEAAHGALPATVEAQTGSGGRHIYLRAPVEVRNDAGRRLGPGLDIRGEGGQVLAPPTLHPNGRPYSWLIGQEPGEHEVAWAPPWLVSLLVADSGANNIPPGIPSPGQGSDDGPAARYNAATTWSELLERDGWTLHHTDRDGEQHWVRPGKERREGTSATVGYRGADMLRVFTSSLAWLPEGAYSRFGYMACREHAGDRSAAARAIVEAEAAEFEHRVTTAAAAAAVDGGADRPRDGDWDRRDLVSIAHEIAAGTRVREAPVFVAVEGAAPLLYRGRVNMLFGESGGGKTWCALAAIVERVQAGERCLLIDYEDTADGTTARLLALGLVPEQLVLVDYRNPSTSLMLGIGDGLDELTDEYALVVLDSTGEGMAASGTNPDRDDEVARWFVLLKKLLRLPGNPAILVLDHIPKADDAPSLYSIGSQRKRAAVTGASYRVDTVKSPARGRDGVLRLTVGKDRLGTRPQGSVACEVRISSALDGDSVGIVFALSEAQQAVVSGKVFRPTHMMERVSRWLEINPGASGTTVEQEVKGKAANVTRQALAALLAEGYVVCEPGPRNARLHRVVRPFRELDEAREEFEAAALRDADGVGTGSDGVNPHPENDPVRPRLTPSDPVWDGVRSDATPSGGAAPPRRGGAAETGSSGGQTGSDPVSALFDDPPPRCPDCDGELHPVDAGHVCAGCGAITTTEGPR